MQNKIPTSGPPSKKISTHPPIQKRAMQGQRNTEKTTTIPSEKPINHKLSAPNVPRKPPPTTTTIIQPSNNSPKAPVVRYHNIDDDEDPEDEIYVQKPLPYNNQRETVVPPHVPSLSTNPRVIVNNIIGQNEQFCSHKQLCKTTSKPSLPPPQTNTTKSNTQTKTSIIPHSPQLMTRDEHQFKKSSANTESLDALTNQFKRLGVFPVNQQEYSTCNNFSEEWMRKKKSSY
ncbi:hypothetical protein FDP41_007903 [Naegleria fowleri]|uniref:Uncharacterized protein n=1 Tax=Naegleria fowleri TaxID=5763 RepID=A0A6A5CEW5_NAEFO|nr:uncharacterized protein FDP41_007903 [Naegleria fowleri]KAF0983988.1 hypothetical protein FDP41_007903 [Naegleria fowleri]